MSDFIVWKFKLLSEGHFGKLHRSGNPSAVELLVSQIPTKVFAKTIKWLPQVWFGIMFCQSKNKVGPFYEPYEECNFFANNQLDNTWGSSDNSFSHLFMSQLAPRAFKPWCQILPPPHNWMFTLYPGSDRVKCTNLSINGVKRATIVNF